MRRTRLVVAALVGVLAVLFGAWRFSNLRTFQLFGELVPRVETTAKAVALTFDDGPTPDATDEVLSVLRERGARATFFLIGADIEQHPELARRIAEEGHEIGNHSFSHQRMVLKTPSFIREEIERTDRLIREAGYEGPIQFRPPYGKKLVLLPYYLSRTNRKTIMWDVEPDSYAEIGKDPDKITRYVLDHARPGSIIILHVMYESRAPSMKSVPGVIDGLKERGYELKTVSDLLALR
jgi:peptidoglycan-N-acetylglucosamine deacetylase